MITSGPTRVSFAENGTDSVAIYVATDADNDNISWSDEHTDAGDFTISASGVLRFSSRPDFENPKDSNRNNIYVVRVKATDDGDPKKSATRTVTVTVTDVNEPPRAPGAPSVSAPSSNGHNRLSVTWSAPSNTGRPDIDDYDVQFRPSTTTSWSDHSFSGTGTSTTILNLSANTLYYVQVRAKNAEGDGSWSSSGSGSTSESPNRAPVITSGPTRVSFTENGTGDVATYVATDADNDNLSWSDEHTDADDFTISSGGVLRFSRRPDYENPRDSNTNNIYVVRVKVTDDGDPKKSATRTVQVTVKDTNEPPRKPSPPSVSAAASNGHERLSVSWSAPANTGPPIDDYDVRYRRSTATSWSYKTFSGTGTSTTITGLSGGTLYYVQVRAENPEGDGSWSSAGSGRTINRSPTITSGPTRVSFTENGSGAVGTYKATDPDGHSLTWSDESTDAGDFTISSGGVLRFSRRPDYENPRDSNTNNIYVVRVRATDDGDPKKSATRSVLVTVKDTSEPPGKPAAPSVSGSTFTSVRVSWSAPANTGPAIDDYDVRYRRSTATSWRYKVFLGTGTSTTITGLTPGALYYVQVRAENPEGGRSLVFVGQRAHRSLCEGHGRGRLGLERTGRHAVGHHRSQPLQPQHHPPPPAARARTRHPDVLQRRRTGRA